MSTISYKCPNCRGSLTFNPEVQQFKCEFCLSNFNLSDFQKTSSTIYNSDTVESTIRNSYANQDWANVDRSTSLYTCPSCGAQMITTKTTSATFCCYCHSAVVLSHQLEGDFRPSKIIPFKFDKDDAKQSFLSWRKKRWFLPKDFSSDEQLQMISGVYIPYWLADCKITGQMSARGTNIRKWSDDFYHYTQTHEYGIYREATMQFNYVPHDGSSKADDRVMASIEPFNYNELRDFDFPYLSGFLAEKYDKTKEDVYPTIKNRIVNVATDVLRDSINGYDRVNVNNMRTYFNQVDFHYALLPIWILTYFYKGKTYLFTMNGQTGKVFGQLPLCAKKLTLTSALLFLIIFTITMVGGFFL